MSRHYFQFWVLQHRKDMDKLEGPHRGSPRQWRLEHLPLKERLGEVGWVSLEKRQLQGH